MADTARVEADSRTNRYNYVGVGMKLPWVSRELFNHVKQQLQDSEDERLWLLKKLAERPEVQADAKPEKEESQGPQPYTTPFDRIEARFNEALRSGRLTDKSKYRARMH
jgi:hypothetical protein